MEAGENDVDAAIREVNETPTLTCTFYFSLHCFLSVSFHSHFLIVYVETDPFPDPFHDQVYEETGLDIRQLIKQDEFIECIQGDHEARMYIICGVSEDIMFEPKARKEIKVSWPTRYSFLLHGKYLSFRTFSGFLSVIYLHIERISYQRATWVYQQTNFS